MLFRLILHYEEQHLPTQRATPRYVMPVMKMASSVPLGRAALGSCKKQVRIINRISSDTQL